MDPREVISSILGKKPTSSSLSKIQLAGVSNLGKSSNVCAQDRLNLYLEKTSDDEGGEWCLYPTPGLVRNLSFGSNPADGLYAIGDNLYVVIMSAFYIVRSMAEYSLAGDLPEFKNGNSSVYMTDNGFQLIITNALASYVYGYSASPKLIQSLGIVPLGSSIDTITYSVNSHTSPVTYDANVEVKTPHGLRSAMSVMITGCSPPIYNRESVQITVTSETSFSYALGSLKPESNATAIGEYTVLNVWPSPKINSVVSTGKVVTVITDDEHGLSSGQRISVVNMSPENYNGSYTVTVEDGRTFNYGLSDDPSINPTTIGYYTVSRKTAFLETGEAHELSTGMRIKISGANSLAFNKEATVYVSDKFTISYELDEEPEKWQCSTAGSYSITAALAKISSAGFLGASTSTFLNGFVINSVPNTAQFQISSLYDAATYDALDFSSCESSPDNLVRVLAFNGYLILFGTSTIEFWGSSGADDFPFARIGATAVDWGLMAIDSVAKFGEGVIFLGANSLGQVQVCLLKGYKVSVISSASIDYVINRYSTKNDAKAFSYLLGGHQMYQINFPTEKKSWLYDGLNGTWSILSSNDGMHFASRKVQSLENNIVSSYLDGTLYTLTADSLTDDGNTIARQFITRHSKSGEFTRLSQLWLETQSGTGLVTGDGSSPQIVLSISRDGGHTWGSEMPASMGEIGKYTTRSMWNRLGRARDFLLKFRMTDPVNIVIIQGWIRYEI